MRREDFERYFKEKITIQFWLNSNTIHPYTGKIISLSEEALVLDDRKEGELTFDYEDIMSPVKILKEVGND